jgi:hypothetical protein
VPVEPGIDIAIELTIRGWSHPEERVTVPSNGNPRWHHTSDAIVDFGPIPPEAKPATLIGTLRLGGTLLGRFRAPVNVDATTSREHFLFGADGTVVGRIATDQRRVGPPNHALEPTLANNWTTRDAWALAVDTGRELGRRLAALVQPVAR